MREQLSPFDIDLRSVERQLDFSDAGKAVSRFLANRNRRLFSMTTENALVTLLREGVSINEASVDSKRDLEEALRQACNDFIEHTCISMASEVLDIVGQKLALSSEALLVDAKFFEANKIKAALTKTSELVDAKGGEMTTQMKLYLDNPATQSILLKPIARKITKSLDEMRKGVNIAMDGTNGWDSEVRAEVVTLMDQVEGKVKACVKASK